MIRNQKPRPEIKNDHLERLTPDTSRFAMTFQLAASASTMWLSSSASTATRVASSGKISSRARLMTMVSPTVEAFDWVGLQNTAADLMLHGAVTSPKQHDYCSHDSMSLP